MGRRGPAPALSHNCPTSVVISRDPQSQPVLERAVFRIFHAPCSPSSRSPSGSGPSGRRFKSSRPDQFFQRLTRSRCTSPESAGLTLRPFSVRSPKLRRSSLLASRCREAPECGAPRASHVRPSIARPGCSEDCASVRLTGPVGSREQRVPFMSLPRGRPATDDHILPPLSAWLDRWKRRHLRTPSKWRAPRAGPSELQGLAAFSSFFSEPSH